jgi:hypothetical protein
MAETRPAVDVVVSVWQACMGKCMCVCVLVCAA